MWTVRATIAKVIECLVMILLYSGITGRGRRSAFWVATSAVRFVAVTGIISVPLDRSKRNAKEPIMTDPVRVFPLKPFRNTASALASERGMNTHFESSSFVF